MSMYVSAKTLVDLARRRAEQEADKPAFILLGDGERESERLTFAQLDAKARAIAAQLQAWNLVGQRAMLIYPHGLDFLTAFLGCFYAGVVAVPTYPPNLRKRLGWGKLEAIISDAGAAVVLSTAGMMGQMTELLDSSDATRSLKRLATDAVAPALAGEWKEFVPRAEELAFLQYSSGSTGRPKGVMLSHGNLLNNQLVFQSFSEEWQEGTYVSWLPLYHDMGLGLALQTVALGCLNVLMSPTAFVQKPRRWLWAVSRYQAHISGGPNFSYDLCVRDMKPEYYEGLDLSSWTTALNGAEVINTRVMQDFTRLFEPYGFNPRTMRPGYGLAEATVAVTVGDKFTLPTVKHLDAKALQVNRVEALAEPRTGSLSLVGCGHPRLGHEVIIVNPETRHTSGAGDVGEVWIRGDSVGMGYWQNPQATEDIFRAHTADTAQGPYLRTGDLGFIENNSLFLTGRMKELVIIRGRNHYPEDIERTVLACHPGLRSQGGAAFSVLIDGEERLVVVQEPERAAIPSIDAPALFDEVRAAIAANHELQLHALLLIEPGSLPKTSSGKIQRRASQQMFVEGTHTVLARWDAPVEVKAEVKPEAKAPVPAGAPELPLPTRAAPTALVLRLATLVATRLGLTLEQYDVDKSFNHYGLDSKALVELSGVMAEALGVPLAPTALYEYPSVAALARFLGGAPEGNGFAASAESSHAEPIALIGMGCRFPGGARSPEAFWSLLRGGVDAISEVPAERWNAEALYSPTAAPGRVTTRWGGFVADVDRFDADFFDISPREAAAMDPQQRLLLEVSWDALENAGQAPDGLAGSQTGVFVGISTQDYARLQVGRVGATNAFAGTGTALSIAANRLSYALDLRGPSLAVDTACSSSLVALHTACLSLNQGECDLALAGGVNLLLSPDHTITFSQAGMMASDGRCKTFDASADGYVRSEGCGVVVLKRLSDAQRDGDRIFAVVRGSAVNQDGHSNGLTAPNGLAQEAVIRRALSAADARPEEIDYVEAHGTGTSLGDPIEVGALARVFNRGRDARRPLKLGSAKTNVGHLEAAAGIVGVIKVALSLHHRQLPGSLHLKTPNPHIPWEKLALEVPTTHQDWAGDVDRRRLAGVSSFGFGGTNAHVVLEQAPLEEERSAALERPQHVLALSAKTPEALRRLMTRYVEALATVAPEALAHLCFSTHTGRAQLPCRVAVVGQDAQELRRKLEQAIQAPPRAPVHASAREVAFLFTGQGALYPGVGRELYNTQPLFRDLIDQCNRLLRPWLEHSLVSLLWGEHSALQQETRYTQPVLFALEYALARLWMSWGLFPAALMGHSIGEYAAACIAGVFSLEDGLRLTAARGKLMDVLTRRGAMAVLFAPLEEVRAAVEPHAEHVAVAAENGPANVVISGEAEVVKRLVEEARARGTRGQLLKVSHAFHSPLVQPMLAAYTEVANSVRFHAPALPLMSGVTGQRAGQEVADPSYWIEHTRGMVRFSESTRALVALRPGFFLEIGPGSTLVSMACAQDERIKGLPSLDRDRGDWARLLTTVGKLFEGGVRIDWKGVERGFARRHVDVPAYPFEQRRHWFEESPAPVLPAVSSASSVGAPGSVDELLVEQTWERVAETVDAQGAAEGVWLVLGGQSLGESLAARITARGGTSVRVEAGVVFQRGEGTWTVEPSRQEDFTRLLAEVDAPVRGIVHLWSLESGTAEVSDLGRMPSLGLMSLVQALARRGAAGGSPKVWAVTRAAVPAGAVPVPPALEQAAIWGLGKVVALEHPELWGGLVDLPERVEAGEASRLLGELLHATAEQQVALRREGRYVARLIPASTHASRPLSIRGDATYLVTGGLGALGLRTARWLVSRGARHLVLVGRSAREAAVRNDLEALMRAGATLRVMRADMARTDEVARVLREIRESLPPLKGIFHAAGVSGGRRALKELRAEDLDAVFGAKVFGAWALHEATREESLDFFVGYSSIASVWGSSGQAHYAAGNHFLDMLAHHRRLSGLPALTINWGPWAESGMGSAAELEAWLAPLGIQALAPASGLAALERLLSTDGVQATVARVNWSVFKDVYEVRGRRPLLERLVPETEAVSAPVPATEAASEPSRGTPVTREELVGQIQRVVGQVLGFEPSQLPERDRGLTTLGMNSLMAVEIKTALQALVGRSLPATIAFDYPTIDALAAHLLGLAAPVAALAPAVAPSRAEAVAIVGIGCRFPGGADSPEAFWSLLQRGVDAISDVPSERWDVATYLDANPDAPGKTYTLSAGLLRQVDQFDATFFGISPREAEAMDPQQRLALELSWAAVESAGYSPAALAGTQTGVFLGVGANEYGRICEAAGDAIDVAYTSTGNALNAIPGRVAYTLGLQGPSMAIDTACSSSMVAVHLACQSLLRGECDTALAGGVNLLLAAESFVALSKGKMLAPRGRCRTFDAEAEGYVRAEGGGVLVLKRLSEAEAAGDAIVAVIRGSAINQDGRSSGLTVPRGPAQQAVITSALNAAGVTPDAVRLIEAHGTGTSLGDPIELHALDAVYGAGRAAERPLVVGSVKTNIGHTEAASGVASLIKLALSLHHGEIPPHLHFQRLNPHIHVDASHIQIPTERLAWPAGQGRRLAAASAFGFSGTNAHIILEEAPVRAEKRVERRAAAQVLTLSGRSEEAVKAAARDYARLLASDAAPALEDVCHTTQVGRAHFKHRLAVAAEDRAGMVARLQAVVDGGEEQAHTARGEAKATPDKVAFLFTGQGSQYVGMARELFETEPVFARTLSRCDALLQPVLGHSLPSLLWGEASAHLNDTRFTQPVMFAMQYALAALWASWGVTPSVVMGHSAGEFVAACVAGVFSLEDGLKLIEARGRLMAGVPEGGEMVAVMAEEHQVKDVLAPYAAELAIAGYNGPAQLVLSGATPAMRAVCEQLERSGIETRKLPISFASHSPLMEPLLARFAEVTATVRYTAPRLPVVSNVTGELAGEEIATADYWVRHIRAAVRFQQSIEAAWAHGCRIFLELGPQHTLVALGQKCAPEGQGTWLASLRKNVKDGTQLMTALAHLYVQGQELSWSALHAGTGARRVSVPTYPFQRKRYWAEARGSRRASLVPTRSQQSLGAPYPGRRLRLPMTKDLRFEIELSAHSPTFLDDHRIHGTVVVPGASHVSMLLSALATVRDPRLGVNSVQDVTFLQALVLPDPQRRTVQLSMERASKDGFHFQIGSFLGEGDEPAWVVHATGRAQTPARAPAALAAPDIGALRAAATSGFTGESFYADFWDMGYTLGASFRWIGEAWLSEGEVLCALTQPVSNAEAELYQLHPGLIDSCFQLVGCVAGSPTALKSKDELFVPFHIDGFHFHGRPKPGARLWCHVKRRGEYVPASNSLTGDIVIFDEEGHLLASVEGFQVRRTHRDVFLRVHQDAYRDWLYALEWKPQAPVGGPRVDYLPGAESLREGLVPYAQELARTLDLDGYTAVLGELETLSLSYVRQGLARLGVVLEKGQTFTTAALMARAGVVARHQRMFHRVLEMLAEAGELRRDGEGWTVVGAAGESGASAASLLARHPAQKAELNFLEQCASQLAPVLRGEVDPVQVLFPGGDLSAASALYSQSVGTRALNLLVEKTLALALEKLPAGRPLRILEVGAGTGGTTARILPLLSMLKLEYVYTDISPLFTEKARETFQAYPFVRYEVLDIERSPVEQGFDAHRYDIVVAANVLHTTRDMHQTLRHVHELMAPGGLLVMVEGTERQRWLDLIFGLTDGWWRFEDVALRPAYPLLSGESWKRVLAETGFTGAEVLVPGRDMPQGVLFARAAETAEETPARAGQWLVLADEGDTGERLGELLVSGGARNVLARVGERYERHADGSFTLRPTRAEDFQRMLEDLRVHEEPLHGVVHLWSLNASPTEDSLPLGELADAATLGCQSTLHLVQSLVKAQGARPPSLWLVTQGAQALEPTAPLPGLAQSSLWGLGRVIALEHPELHCVRVDLHPTRPDAEALYRELHASRREEQVLLHGAARHVARLAPLRDEAPTKVTFHPEATYLLTGGTGGLGLLTAQWMVREGARHLVLLGRTDAEARTRTEREELERLGAEVVLVQADVADPRQMERVLERIDRTLPPLRGIIHGVGVLDDGILAHQTWERFARVLSPKVDGAWNLHTLTAHRELDFFVLYSSAVSLMGSPGQANHAAANAFLDGLASYRRAQGKPALSINWGPWSGKGAASGKELGDRWALKGIGTIAPTQGIEILEQLFLGATHQVGVLPVQWPAFLSQFPEEQAPRFLEDVTQAHVPREVEPVREAPRTPQAPANDLRRQLEQAAPAQRQPLLVTYIRESMARSLKLAAAELDVEQPLNTLGVDSLLAVEFKKRIRTDLDIDVPVVSMLEGLSIDQLASRISGAGPSSAPVPVAVAAEQVQDVIEGEI